MTSVDDDRVMAGFRDYAGKFAMPVMLLAVGTRFVLKIKQTAEVALKSGEEPRRGDVLLVGGAPGVADELAFRLGAMSGSAELAPDLELGETRRLMGTSKYVGAESGFWLSAETRRRLAVGGLQKDAEATGSDVATRFFRSSQPMDLAPLSPSDLEALGSPDFECPTLGGAPRYACLCPNCPAKWTSVVYVLASREDVACRVAEGAGYVAPWETHAASYLSAPDADVDLLALLDDTADTRPIVAAPNATRRILVVKQEDLDAAPVPAVVAVAAWLVQGLQQDADTADAAFFAVDPTVLLENSLQKPDPPKHKCSGVQAADRARGLPEPWPRHLGWVTVDEAAPGLPAAP